MMVLIHVYGLIILNTGVSFAFIPYVRDYFVSGGMDEEPHTFMLAEDPGVVYYNCSTNLLSITMRRVADFSRTQYINLKYPKARGTTVIPVTGPEQLPYQEKREYLLLSETRSNTLNLQYISSLVLSMFENDSFGKWTNIDRKQANSVRFFSAWESASLEQWFSIDHMRFASSGLLSSRRRASVEQWPNIDHIQTASSIFQNDSSEHLSNIAYIQTVSAGLSTFQNDFSEQWSDVDHIQTVSPELLSTFQNDSSELMSNIDHIPSVSSESFSTWENDSSELWWILDDTQTISIEILSTWSSASLKQQPNIAHIQPLSTELFSTFENYSSEQWTNMDDTHIISSRLFSRCEISSEDKWLNITSILYISFRLFSICGCDYLEQWSNIDDTQTVSCELLSTWDSASLKQSSYMNSTQSILVISYSTWRNGSLDKWSNIDNKQPATHSICPFSEDICFKNLSKRHFMERHRKDTQRYLRTLGIDSTGIFYSNSHMNKTSNTPDVFQILKQLEGEMQRQFNILHYTSCPYIKYFETLIMNKNLRDNHLLSHKPVINSDLYWRVLSILIPHTLFIYWMLKVRHKHHLPQRHPWFKRKIYWFIFCMLTIRFRVFVYFPTTLLTIQQLRRKLLQNLYPVVSPGYKKMIYRRHKRYKREIIRTKIKVFFQFYVKWVKAFDLEKRYVRSANIKDSFFKKKSRKHRGGRKKKCSFRKSGPFFYGRVLHKRCSLQNRTHLARAFKVFKETLQRVFNHAFISTQSSLIKTGEKVSDAANNFIDIFRLRRIPFQAYIVRPFLDPSMQNEFSRVATYATFPTNTPVSTLRLARAGFFYTGQSDVVECFHCRVQHRNWDKNDLPTAVHRRISPSCDFIVGSSTQNISIDRSSIQSGLHTSLFNSENGETSGELTTLSSEYQSTGAEQSSTYPSTGHACSSENSTTGSERIPTSSSTGSGRILEVLSYDSIGYGNQCSEQSIPTTSNPRGECHQTAAAPASRFEIREHSTERNGLAIESELQNRQAHFSNTNSVKKANSKTQKVETIKLKPLSDCHDRPKHLAYAVITVRMSSFKGWSSYTGQTPRELAAAGLFYSGYADLVTCWFCGIRLQSWETDDDPWIEHAKWAPTCVFLRRIKGDEFILLVHESNKRCSHSNDGSNENGTHTASTQRAPEETQTPLQLAASVEKVKAMGYSTGIIKKAIEKLQRDNIPIDTFNIVHELDQDDRSYFNSKPDPVKVCELTWNTRGHAQEVDSCSDGITTAMDRLDIQETNRVMEENRRLKQDMKCKICIDMVADITFIPCGHFVCCEGCGFAVAKCPVCLNAIDMRVKTRMS